MVKGVEFVTFKSMQLNINKKNLNNPTMHTQGNLNMIFGPNKHAHLLGIQIQSLDLTNIYYQPKWKVSKLILEQLTFLAQKSNKTSNCMGKIKITYARKLIFILDCVSTKYVLPTRYDRRWITILWRTFAS